MNAAEYQALQNELTDIRISMKQIADAMTRLAVLEERHSVVAQLASKVDSKANEQEKEISSLKTEIAVFKAKADTVGQSVRVVWAVFGSAFLLVAGRLIYLAM